MEGQLAEFSLADGAPVVDDRGQVQPFGADVEKNLAGTGVADGGGIAGHRTLPRHPPLPADKTWDELCDRFRGNGGRHLQGPFTSHA